MKIITNLKINCSREDTLKVLKSKESSPIYKKIISIYGEMYTKAKSVVDIKGSFKIIESSQVNFLKSNNKYFIPCLLTLGEKISDEVTKLFQQQEPLKALVLDTIADQILFNAGNELYNIIQYEIEKLNFNITERISPGNSQESLKLQADILGFFNEINSLDITLTESFMMKPVKSLAYYYEGDANINQCLVDHSCSNCKSVKCDFSNKEITIKIINKRETKEILATRGKSILSLLRENSIYINSSCNGLGTCGKCRIRLLKGSLKITENDAKFLSTHELNAGIRLACFAYPESNVEIELFNYEESYQILTEFNDANFVHKHRIETIPIKNMEEMLVNQKSLTDVLNTSLNAPLRYSLKALKNLGKLYNKEKFNIIKEENYVINISEKSQNCSYGIIIDIGTTTIGLIMVDLIKGIIIGEYSVLNPQSQFGADVISRIHYSSTNDSDILTKTIRRCVDKSIKELCRKLMILEEDVHKVVIAGNTTMIYFLLGLPSHDLAQNPFTTIIKEKQTYDYYDFIKSDLLDCKVTILPSISAFVGGDIVSGLLYHNFQKLNETVLLIDIGTNGEIALGNSDKIYCVSTAAGPAFEGASIVDGIGSVNGAISKVFLNENNFIEYKTIGDTEPVGICGSGIVDVIALGLDKQWIDNMGRLNKEIYIAKGKDKEIKLYQKDIREVQLAKSAIKTGIEILIEIFNVKYDEIDKVLIAGGFGNKIDIENAIKIGIIPSSLKSKVSLVGNSSLAGGLRYLLDKESDNSLVQILEKTRYFELANREDFNEKFISNISF